MSVTLQEVERLAPDQASLTAAAGLARPEKWTGLAGDAAGRLLWGECAGSGANPYRVIVDVADHGTKCTCPSRKFPCKHALALLWLAAENTAEFATADAPEWVSDWLGRRRGPSSRPSASPAAEGPANDLSAAREAQQEEAVPDDATLARRAAAAARRAADTEAAVLEGLAALEQWVADQLRHGLAGFLDDATARCRRIASRLVDAKAAALAGRVDELPARLLDLPRGDRVRGAVVELGKLVVLARAYRSDPTDGGVRRQVISAEPRDTVLADPAALRLSSVWEVVAETVQTRRDGLVAQTSWLLNLEQQGPRFGMLQDVYPGSAGRRSAAFTPGDRFQGEFAFHSGASPLRALLVARGADVVDELSWPAADPLDDTVGSALLAEPWSTEVPVLLGPGRVVVDASDGSWWRSAAGDLVPIVGDTSGIWRGTELLGLAGIWSGGRLRLLAARTPWGRIGAA